MLEEKARWVRQQILEMVVRAGRGHIGGSLSCVEILLSLEEVLEEGRLILSKGHVAEAVYAVLADAGYFPMEWLQTFGDDGSPIGDHISHLVPGVELSTGSLGHGLGVAAGMALADKIDGLDRKTFCLLGDGECYEGSVWESVMFAANQNLSNLVAIVDRNGKMTLGEAQVGDLKLKFSAFGWGAFRTDGHSFARLAMSYKLAGVVSKELNRPVVIIAETVKGKGISFMETEGTWHHQVPNEEQTALARKELYNGL